MPLKFSKIPNKHIRFQSVTQNEHGKEIFSNLDIIVYTNHNAKAVILWFILFYI